MRVIVLWAWTYELTLVVVVILIPDVPVEPLEQPNRQASFRRLKAHGIRCDQGARAAGRIWSAAALTVVLVNPVRPIKCYPGHQLSHSINVKEMIPHEVKAVTKWMLNAIEEIFDHSVTINPIVVIASANRES